MPAKPTHELLATIGEYTDRNGEKKKRRLKLGTVFLDDEGRQSIRFEAMPFGVEWSGWANMFPIEKKEQGPPAGRYESARAMDEARDDIPF